MRPHAPAWGLIFFLFGLLLSGAASPVVAATLTIVDTDFGVPPIDDSFAVALALASPGVHVVGITTVAGNQKLALENAQLAYVLERLGHANVPVYSGAASPIDAPPAYRAFLADPSRKTFFPAQAPAAPSSAGAGAHLRGEPAAQFIARTVLAHPGRVTIVCIGPLTNVAQAIERDPRVAHAIGLLLIGGGYVRTDPDGGEPTGLPGSAYAEFNFWVDPRAASIVLRSGAPIVVVPLNVNKQTPFTPGEYHTMLIGRSRFARLLRTFAPAMPTYAGRPLPMFDEDVVAALLDPHVAARHRVSLDVITQHGSSFGESIVVTRHGRGVEVLWLPRAALIRDLVAERLAN